MNQEDFTNAYILLFSGAAELKGKAVKWKDKNDEDVYIEFPDLIPTHVIVRKYWDNGKLFKKYEWINGLQHGKELWWYRNGKLNQERNWINGLQHGKNLGWHKNGKLYWECNWVNDLRHGKELRWFNDGELYKKYEWVNGNLIK